MGSTSGLNGIGSRPNQDDFFLEAVAFEVDHVS
jgi:hypothetical protein